MRLVHKVVACGDSAGLQFLCDGSNGDGLQRLDGNIPGGSYGDIAVTEEGAVRIMKLPHSYLRQQRCNPDGYWCGGCAGFRDGSFLPDRPCHESWHRCHH